MNSRTARAIGALALALAVVLTAGGLAPPAVAVPQNTCVGAFCASLDLATNDALAPGQATTSAAQPTNLSLRFSDTSAAVATDKSTWLSKVSAVLGSSSTKGMAIADPASLPLGAYLAGTAASAGACSAAADYATACPAGFGSGQVAVTPLIGAPAIKPATFGVTRVTTGVGGVMTAELSVTIPSVSVAPITSSATLAYAPATGSVGPSLAMGAQPALGGVLLPPYTGGSLDFSMTTITLNLNGLVTEAATGAVSPAVAFVRQATLCTSVTSSLFAQARSGSVASAAFTQTITGCPATPGLVAVTPDPAKPRTFTFSMKPPTAAVGGRTASLEWVFGDGSKAITGATTTHPYPVANPVIAVVTVVDSAGARSSSLQVRIGSSAVRGKQKEGNLITGMLLDQDTGEGVADQEILGFRCANTFTPVASCERIGTTVTRLSGAYRLRIPEVKKKGFVVVSHAGTATTSAARPARFGSTRVVEVLPQPEVTLKVSDKRVRPGTRVRLSGTVAPGKKGQTVRLQGFIRGKWRSIGKATVSAKGTFAASYVVRVPRRSRVKVRALVPGTAATLEATSKVRVIRVIAGQAREVSTR